MNNSITERSSNWDDSMSTTNTLTKVPLPSDERHATVSQDSSRLASVSVVNDENLSFNREGSESLYLNEGT